MEFRAAVNTGFLGGMRNRFMTYQDDRPLAEKIRIASRIPGLSGVELGYPRDFRDPAELRKLLSDSGLAVAAVNYGARRAGTWWRGSYASSDPAERAEVVGELKKAMDAARDLGCSMVTTCPNNDGSDYLFEIDYGESYRFLEESFRTAAGHDREVKIALEYKTGEPRTQCLLGNAGETLTLCRRIGLTNVGVALDFGHSLFAGERPAQAAALIALENRLFCVHLSDNDRRWDWDMSPGSFNPWETLEFFFHLKLHGYDGWFSFDVFPKEIDASATFSEALETARRLFAAADKIEIGTAGELSSRRNPVESLRFMYGLLGRQEA